MAERVPPNSAEAENALLGCLIIDSNLYNQIVENLYPEDFYYAANQTVFKAIQNMADLNVPIDQTTLTDRLKKMGEFESIGGFDYIASLLQAAPFERNVKEYSKIVKDYSTVRNLIKAASEILDLAYSKNVKLSELIDSAETKVFDVSQGNTQESFITEIHDIVSSTMNDISELSKNRGKLTGLSTGFKEIDYMTSGLQKSDLIIIAARPSMGKTALALNIANHVGLEENKSILIFSLEMSSKQLVQRMLLSEALIDSTRIRMGDLNGEDDWVPLMISAKSLSKTNIAIVDKPGINLSEMRSICRRRQMKEPIDMIIVDYMQLMSGNGRRENRTNEISEISRGLKQLAREMDCPLICLSQLARGPETRNDKRPLLSDLRDSGSIEQDADVVMFLYRDYYYNKETGASPYDAELNIAKQRNGPTGTVHLRWLADYTKFTEPDKTADREETA